MSKYESAELILKLYDLRREKKMRKARNWLFTFEPESADHILQTMMHPEDGPYFRMVTSYWDMAAALVNHGAIDAEMFRETAGEYLFVFAKLKPFLQEIREKLQNPDAYKHLETFIMGDEKTRQRLEQVIEWLQQLKAQKAEAATK